MFIVGLCWFTSKLAQYKHILDVTLTFNLCLSESFVYNVAQTFLNVQQRYACILLQKAF